MPGKRFEPLWLFACLLGVFLGAAGPVRGADSLERALLRQAPKLIKLLQEKGCENVGVLKFLVARDGKRESDNVGTLNLLIARRLEVALLLANDPRKPIGILRNASAVAARTAGGNHLDAAGRGKLFGADYPLAWGNKEVKADAFFTGRVAVSKDLSTMTVRLLVFARGDAELRPACPEFKVANQANQLVELSESFLLRGGADAETGARRTEDRNEKAIQDAAQVRTKKVRNPLQDLGQAPVTLEILYDDKPIAIEYRDGKAFVREPSTGQKVAFTLKRDASKKRYGVVLKVNGENTLGRQTVPDLYCQRWILEPGDAPTTIRGFQVDEKTAREFTVLSARESKEREVNYGADVGTVSLSVFGERSGQTEEPIPEERDAAKVERYARLVAATRLPAKSAENFHALKAQLLDEARRGLIAEGNRIASKMVRVTFLPDPVPVSSVTVIYYKP